MKRAAELFAFELRSSRSPLIEQTWQTCSEPEQSLPASSDEPPVAP